MFHAEYAEAAMGADDIVIAAGFAESMKIAKSDAVSLPKYARATSLWYEGAVPKPYHASVSDARRNRRHRQFRRSEIDIGAAFVLASGADRNESLMMMIIVDRAAALKHR